MHNPAVNGYYTINNVRLPRVTSILKVRHNEGLDRWRRDVGFEQADVISREATTLGTQIHAACEALNNGEIPCGDEDLQPFIDAYRAWLTENVAEILAAERLVYNLTDRYAGQADAIARMKDGRRMLIDLKSSNSISEDYRLQCIAYVDALADMGEPVDGHMIVQLPSRKPGELAVTEYPVDEIDVDREAWRACLCLYRWAETRRNDWRRFGLYVKREA